MENEKTAIVLAMFGTSVESGLGGILEVFEGVKDAFSGTRVVMSFTSNFLRAVWRKRASDPSYRLKNRSIPEEVLRIQGPLAVLGNLHEQGYRNVVVQAVHITPGEEYLDLRSQVEALASIRTVKEKYRPFERLVLGRPALGALSSERYPFAADIRAMARALRADAEMAVKEARGLVYLGHGNKTISTCGSYLELESRMRTLYPGLKVFFGFMDGFPAREDVITNLQAVGCNRVILKPFMLVAGMHAARDMVGPGRESWKSALEEQGIEVTPVLSGLGEQKAVAGIFIDHIRDAAREAGIALEPHP